MMEEEEEEPRQGDIAGESATPDEPPPSGTGDEATGDAHALAKHLHGLVIRAPAQGGIADLDKYSDEELIAQFGRRLCEADGGVWGRSAGWDGVYSKDNLNVYVKFMPTSLVYPVPGIPGVAEIAHLIIVSRDAGPIRSREHLVEMISPRAAAQIVLPSEFRGFLQSAAPADIGVNQYSLGDHPVGRVADDRLQFADYAIALANLVDNPETETPLTIAIHAAWGVGKSSLGKMIQDRLSDKPAARRRGAEWQPMAPHRIFWFNAWRHDEANSLVTAFVAELARDCFRHSSLFSRIFRPLPASMRTKWMSIWAKLLQALIYLSITLLLGAAVILAITSLGVNNVMAWLDVDETSGQKIVAALAGGSLLTAIPPIIKWALSMRSSIEQFVADPKEAAAKGLIGDTRDYVAALVRRSVPDGSRLMIFIDDIERCRGSGGIDLLEAINQLLMQHEAGQSSLPIVVIVLGDIDLVALAAGTKYKEIAEYSAFIDPIPNLATSISAEDMKKASIYHHGRRHLQKIVQLRFNLIPADASMIATLSQAPEGDRQAAGPSVPVSAVSYLQGELGRMLRRLEPLGAAIEGRSALELWREPRTLLTYHQTRRDLPPFSRTFVSFFGAYGYVFMRVAQAVVAPGYFAAYLAAEFAYPRIERIPRLTYSLRQLLTINSASLLLGMLAIYCAIYLLAVYLDPTIYTDIFGQQGLPFPLWAAALVLVGAGLVFLVSGFSSLRRKDQQRLALYASADHSLKPEERESPIYKRIQEAQADLAVTNESAFFKDAQARVLADLSLTPRMVKRCANRIRLMMSILDQRKLLGEDATGKVDPAQGGAAHLRIGVSAAALGKWVAFEEKWPDLARTAMKDPALLAAWEGAVRGGAGQDAQSAAIMMATDKEGIFGFLKRDPDLSGVAEQLLGLRAPKRSKPA